MNPKGHKRNLQPRSSLSSRLKRPTVVVLIGALVMIGLIVSLLPHIAAISSPGPGRALYSGAGSPNGGVASDARDSLNSRAAQESPAGNPDALHGLDDSAAGFSGIKSTLDPSLAVTGSGSRPNSEAESEAKAPLPLVLQSVDPGLLHITPEQQQVIDSLRQMFVDMVGGPDQDPNDPQYLERWQRAQPVINQELKAQLGVQFFLSYDTAAAQTRVAKAAANRQSE